MDAGSQYLSGLGLEEIVLPDGKISALRRLERFTDCRRPGLRRPDEYFFSSELDHVSGFRAVQGTWIYYPHFGRSEEHTSELQSPTNLVCRLLLEKKKNKR